jgi:hypothetical protein
VISLSSVLVRIREQVRDDLRQPRRIARDLRQVRRDGRAQHLAALRQQARHQVLGVLDDLREYHRLVADAELARLDSHALQQVVDEACQAQRAALEGLEQFTEPLARHAVEAVEHELDRGELRGERRAELVGDVREHGVARAADGL